MPPAHSGCRPVQIKIAVEDVGSSVDFYRTAFGLDYQVARRTQSHEGRAFVFGAYGGDDFFLLWLLDDPSRSDRPGTCNLSFLVEDLDETHARAFGAGAEEVGPPRHSEGMPRNSAVKDPSGNWIGLAQGWPGVSGCRPVQIKIAVDDADSSVAFYQKAFGLDYRVARRTQSHEGRAFTFGTYGGDDFFLLWLLDEPGRCDRPGTSNFSFLVGDLDGTHARAIDAGATEVCPPRDAEGMPRNSAVKDPSGNWIGLAQS